MNKFGILLFSLFLSLSLFSQKTIIDTSQVCIPYPVAQRILLDLNEYDKLKEVIVTYKNEVYELNNKVLLLNKENEAWISDNKLNKEIISEKNNAIEIYKNENQDLRKENKRLETKNGLIMIISAVIITPLIYLSAFK